MPREAFFDSGGVKLHFIDWGGAGKPMALLAGLGDTAHLYLGLAAKLSSQYRVVGLTQRGHGQSDRPESGYDLDTFVQDIRCFLDALGIERSILVGHSFGGLEIALFARRYPQRAEAIVYLDALFPKLDPEPDLSGDPVGAVLPVGGPAADDLDSREAYFAYYKRARPAWARIWCEAIEADLMAKVTSKKGGGFEFHHDDELMNRIYREVWSSRDPQYDGIKAPMLAIVPDGNFHQGVPLDATDQLRRAADRYWADKIVPWIRQRTDTFVQLAPAGRIVRLDSPYHHIFIAEEDDTVKAIRDFLAG